MTASHASGLRERLRPLPYGHSTVSDHAVMGASARGSELRLGLRRGQVAARGGCPTTNLMAPTPATIAGHVDEGVAL